MLNLTKDEINARIAKNIAALFNEADKITIINLGVGIPTQVSNYVHNEKVFLQAENGMLGVGPIATGDEIDPQLINAGRQPVKLTPGCSFFDSTTSFAMIRGGHIDATVLGAFEVDQNGDVANWIIPNGKMFGVGGAMDLVAGARQVIIAMTHTSKKGSKLVKKCSLPVTGIGEVDVVVTELGQFRFKDGKVILEKIAPEIDLDYIRSVTELDYEVSPSLTQLEP